MVYHIPDTMFFCNKWLNESMKFGNSKHSSYQSQIKKSSYIYVCTRVGFYLFIINGAIALLLSSSSSKVLTSCLTIRVCIVFKPITHRYFFFMDTILQYVRVYHNLCHLTLLLPSSRRVSRHHLRLSCTPCLVLYLTASSHASWNTGALNWKISRFLYAVMMEETVLVMLAGDIWWHEQAAREDIIIVFWICLYVCR